MAVNIVWFKRDLRLTDHAALQLASQLPEPTLLVYLIEPSLLRNPHYRGRHWQFIGQSLEDLQHAVQVTGHRIAVLEGDAVEVFGEVHRRLGVKRLLSYEETGLEVQARPSPIEVLPSSGYRVARIPDQRGRTWPTGSKRLESIMAPRHVW